MSRFKNYCTCGGYALTMNNRNKEQPHMEWCPQYKEYEEWHKNKEKSMIELDLKELIGKYNEVIHIKGKEEPGDGGEGYFVWVDPLKEEENTGAIITEKKLINDSL